MEIGQLLVDEQFLPAAQKLISNAHRSICVSSFKAEISHKPRGRSLTKFFDTVIEKSRHGVDVRFIINRTNPRGSIPLSNVFAIQTLQKAGVKVRCLTNQRVCHAKILLVDEFTAIFGSHNLSVKSCHNNFEVSYILNDIYIVEHLYKIFNRVWETAQKA